MEIPSFVVALLSLFVSVLGITIAYQQLRLQRLTAGLPPKRLSPDSLLWRLARAAGWAAVLTTALAGGFALLQALLIWMAREDYISYGLDRQLGLRPVLGRRVGDVVLLALLAGVALGAWGGFRGNKARKILILAAAFVFFMLTWQISFYALPTPIDGIVSLVVSLFIGLAVGWLIDKSKAE